MTPSPLTSTPSVDCKRTRASGCEALMSWDLEGFCQKWQRLALWGHYNRTERWLLLAVTILGRGDPNSVVLTELLASKFILLDNPLSMGKGQLPAHHPGGWPINGGRPNTSSFYLEVIPSGGSTSLFWNSSDCIATTRFKTWTGRGLNWYDNDWSSGLNSSCSNTEPIRV